MASSMAIAAAASLLALAGPALAAPETALTAERAAEIQHQGVQEAVGTAPCRRDAVAGDIVVCGRRAPGYMRIPDEPLPGDREDLIAGEPPRAQSSFDTCVIGCQASGIRFDVIRTAKVGSRIVRHILGKDD